MEKGKEGEMLKKALHRVKIADRIRMIFLFAALLLVLFVFYGNKVAANAAWFTNCKGVVYSLLSVVICIMLAATVAKIFLAAAYNRLVKKQKEM